MKEKELIHEEYHRVIRKVAKKMKLPLWWVEAIAIEYTECREYATDDDIWTFNFDKLSEKELLEAVKNNKVVVYGCLIHNVKSEVWRTRLVEKMVSDIPVNFAEEANDIIPEGPVSEYHTPFIGNPIDVWDPKLNFSNYFQVYDEREIWQWKIASLKSDEEKKRSIWVSSEVYLKSINEISDKLSPLRNPVIKPGEAGHEEFKKRVKDFYKWLNEIRYPIMSELEKIHIIRKQNFDKNNIKVTEVIPPLLSRFETFTIKNGNFFTKFYAEPVFYRGCRLHAKKAEDLYSSVKNELELVSKLDEIYQERAVAIILGTACVEAFINGVGFENFPDIWPNIEKLSIVAKWQLFLKLHGKGSIFDIGKEPYQTLNNVVKSRNELVHFKRKYEKVKVMKKNEASTVLLEQILNKDLVHNLPLKIEELIREVSKETSLTIPPWLNSKIY